MSEPGENPFGEEEKVEAPDISRFEKKEDLSPYLNFQIRPELGNRFKCGMVKEVIHNVLHETLTGKKYPEEDVETLSKTLANTIRHNIEGIVYQRYKLIVHVVLGEQKGAGVKVAARCLWDPECDAYVSDSFISDSIFCVASVFGILFY